MKSLLRILTFTCLGLLLVDCGAQSPKRSSPQRILTEAQISADRLQFETTPKLDVLFVVDNSLSMDVHQANLGKNINDFVKAFTSNALIDFHIGIIAIYDSDKNHKAAVEAKHPLGHLIQLQDPNPNVAPGTPFLVNGAAPPPFATRDTPNLVPVLAKTLFLGTDPGPEYEEMFSPVEAFFSDELLNGVNKGFYRSDAHLLIVWITDANDSTIKTSSEKLYSFLSEKKGKRRDLVHLYSIISPVSDPSCHKDQAGPAYKFNLITAYSDGKILSLCSPTFGQELAKFGQTLSAQVGYQIIQLDRHPDANSKIRISYGSQIIPPATPPKFDDGWSYDSDPNVEQIMIGGNLKLKPEPGAKINVEILGVDYGNIRNTSTPATPGSSQVTPSINKVAPPTGP